MKTRELRVSLNKKYEQQIPPELRDDLNAMLKAETRVDLLNEAMSVDSDLRLMLNTKAISYELDNYVRDTYFTLLEDCELLGN